MRNKYKYIISLILLMGFAFNFAHSELGFMTPEGDISHYAHDFCQLTHAAPAKGNIHTDTFIQKNIQPFFALVCILPETANFINSQLRQVSNTFSLTCGISDTPLFVINRTLLI